MSESQPNQVFQWSYFNRHKVLDILWDVLLILVTGNTTYSCFLLENWFLVCFSGITCFIACQMAIFKIRTIKRNPEVHFILSNSNLEYWIKDNSNKPVKSPGWLSKQFQKIGIFFTLNQKMIIEKEAIKDIQFSQRRDKIIIHFKTGKSTTIDLNSLEALDKRELLLDELSKWHASIN